MKAITILKKLSQGHTPLYTKGLVAEYFASIDYREESELINRCIKINTVIKEIETKENKAVEGGRNDASIIGRITDLPNEEETKEIIELARGF